MLRGKVFSVRLQYVQRPSGESSQCSGSYKWLESQLEDPGGQCFFEAQEDDLREHSLMFSLKEK